MVADADIIKIIERVRRIEHDLERTKTVENATAGGGSSIPAPAARGDMIAANAVPAWARLPLAGASGYVLTRNDTDPTWSNVLAIGADDQIGLQIRAHSAGQSAHLQEWQDSATNILLWVDEGANLHLPQNTSVVGAGIIYKEETIFIHNYYSGFGLVSGYNTFVGMNSGNLTMGSTATELYHASYDTAMGYETLTHNTLGYRNTAMGYHALHANTTGYTNTAIGNNALVANTTGYANVAIGASALVSGISAYGNVAIGYGALDALIDGGYNVVVGDGLSNAWYVSGSIAIGQNAVNGLRLGGDQIGIGTVTLYANCPHFDDVLGFSDYSATIPGTVLCSSVLHGLPPGTTDNVVFIGNNPYVGAGPYTVTYVDNDSFYFTEAWLGSGTGYWYIETEATQN